MADKFLAESWSFLYNFLVNGLIATVVFMLATILLRKFDPRGRENSGENTSFCSSAECVRCSHGDRTSTAILDATKALKDFELIRGSGNGLERLYKGIEYVRTHGGKETRLTSQKPTVFYLSGLRCQTWHDKRAYSDKLNSLTSSLNLNAIKSELQDALINVSRGWFANSTPEGEWWVFYLYNQGKKVEENCTKCPRTTEVVESIESFLGNCSFGNALFSVVRAQTHITPHFGPTNCRIRCHVPLLVPDGCSLCVDGEQREWKEKELLIFDDSFLHEVWHRGKNGDRAILMVDLWHPDLTVTEKEAIKFIFPPIAKSRFKI